MDITIIGRLTSIGMNHTLHDCPTRRSYLELKGQTKINGRLIRPPFYQPIQGYLFILMQERILSLIV